MTFTNGCAGGAFLVLQANFLQRYKVICEPTFALVDRCVRAFTQLIQFRIGLNLAESYLGLQTESWLNQTKGK